MGWNEMKIKQLLFDLLVCALGDHELLGFSHQSDKTNIQGFCCMPSNCHSDFCVDFTEPRMTWILECNNDLILTKTKFVKVYVKGLTEHVKVLNTLRMWNLDVFDLIFIPTNCFNIYSNERNVEVRLQWQSFAKHGILEIQILLRMSFS